MMTVYQLLISSTQIDLLVMCMRIERLLVHYYGYSGVVVFSQQRAFIALLSAGLPKASDQLRYS